MKIMIDTNRQKLNVGENIDLGCKNNFDTSSTASRFSYWHWYKLLIFCLNIARFWQRNTTRHRTCYVEEGRIEVTKMSYNCGDAEGFPIPIPSWYPRNLRSPFRKRYCLLSTLFREPRGYSPHPERPLVIRRTHMAGFRGVKHRGE